MSFLNLSNFLSSEPKFRLAQAQKLIFQNYISSWGEASNFPLPLREKLEQELPLEINGEILNSKNEESLKALITFSDGQSVETVLMKAHDDRRTICVSSQIGCPLGCEFCATGELGFKRNLTTDEIITQALFWARYLKKTGEKVSNVVFMGMGEPFLNYGEVLKAVRVLNNKEYFNIGARHISISTAGIIEGIKKLTKENLQINLAVSLNAPTNSLRCQLMPISKRYSLSTVLRSVDNYIEQTGRQVMFEYILIKDVNDSKEQAVALAELMKQPLYFLNLIVYNQTKNFKPSDKKTVEEFRAVLKKAGIKFSERYRFGSDIDAACGQLAGKRRDGKTKRK